MALRCKMERGHGGLWCHGFYYVLSSLRAISAA